jgi:formylmethanofuran dehydrogenase subunit C
MSTGTYSGEFIKSDGTILYDPNIQITEISESYIVINGSSISRNKCTVDGTIDNMSILYQGGPVIIQGEIDKKKGQYLIEGSFNTFQGPQAYPISGKFEIKSN